MENAWKSSLKEKHVAVVGLGSGGSAVADMLWRMNADKMYGHRLTFIDPDTFYASNMTRHILRGDSVGHSKALEMAKKYPGTRGIQEKFHGLEEKPDVIASCVDSLACESLINAYSLQNKVPVVYGGVHGYAHTAEIITVVPGETPCYECWERIGELPTPRQEAYTDPGYDKTKMPHQEGLWCDILMSAALQVQAILGVLGMRKRLDPLALMSLRHPFKVVSYDQKERCAVCSDNMEGLWTDLK
jgi:molybdopterin/thiamine biosynthesis adenylyltransferase